MVEHTYTLSTGDNPDSLGSPMLFAVRNQTDRAGVLDWQARVNVDTVSIVSGAPPEPSITEIEYSPDTAPPTVTLTWLNTGAASYSAWLSRDLSDWSEDLSDNITSELDERPEDADHITLTFDLDGGRENEEDLFFRIEAVQ